jgi:outer membrane protein assembly factor BamE (lipoprotein component of BamABCDE complex)
MARARDRARPAGRPSTYALLVAIGSISFGLVACSPTVRTHGHVLDEAALARIEPGRTSRDQVAQLLGSPSSRGTFDGEAWYYVSQRTERHSFYQETVVEQNVVAIIFDEQGVVRDVERRDLDDARNIELVERETPTVGSELTIVEQFIGNIGRFNLPQDDRVTGEPRPPGR